MTGTPSPTVESLTSPTFDTPPGVYTAIAVGANHACALTESGEAVCWNVENSTQWETPPGPYTYITANGDTTCAASTAGEIECWLLPGSEWGVLPGRLRRASTSPSAWTVVMPAR